MAVRLLAVAQVMEELAAYHYDLEQLQHIFKRHQHHEGLGYVNERWGAYREAICDYRDEFKAYSHECIDRALAGHHYSTQHTQPHTHT